MCDASDVKRFVARKAVVLLKMLFLLLPCCHCFHLDETGEKTY